MIWDIFRASFKQFSLSLPDVNKNKGVAERAPFCVLLSSVALFDWETCLTIFGNSNCHWPLSILFVGLVFQSQHNTFWTIKLPPHKAHVHRGLYGACLQYL